MDNKNSNYGEKLYSLLPPLYRTEDAKIRPTPFPLKRFLQIAGTGFDHLDEKLKGHENLFDVDRTPRELLPHLAQMMGFDFPYDMTEFEQRTFLKVLPILYKYKGTSRVFDYLGQVIFGQYTIVNVEYYKNHEPDRNYEHGISVYLQVEGDVIDVSSKAERYRRFAESFRPLNTVLNPVVQVFYSEDYMRINNGDIDITVVISVDTDTFNKNNLADSEEKIILLNMEVDSYNGDKLDDDYSFMTISPEKEIYSVPTSENTEDYAHYIGASLGLATLNNTMVLNSKRRIVRI